MINIKDKHCEFPGCSIVPVYGLAGNKATHCKEHAITDMINVRDKRCEFTGCTKIPTYGMRGCKRTYCKEHASVEMIDVLSKRCEYPECTKIPTYGLVNGKKTHCKEHSTADMIDVIHSHCEFPECTTRAQFGPLFGPKKHCSKHKKPHEFAKNNPKCESKGCKERPFWSDESIPKSCEKHKQPTYKNIIEKPCKMCGLTYYLKDDLCSDCEGFMQKRHKVKEERIGVVLKAANINYYSADKTVDNGCSKYRPDYIVSTPLFEIIVEVDEHQHKSYACECEIARMVNLHQDFGGKPVVFIRYNPDEYINHLGKKVKANDNQSQRERALVDCVNKLTKETEWNYGALAVIYLFYDGYESVKITKLDYFNNVAADTDIVTA